MGNKKENNNSVLKKRKVSQERIDNFDLTKHLVDFLWNEPFYSRILRSLNKIESKYIPTAGVTSKDTDITLLWNREFMAGLSNREVIGLLKHECLHLVFGHTTERRRDPHLIWNYATDLAINSTIPENELPEGGLIPGKALSYEQDQLDQLSEKEKESFLKMSKLIENQEKIIQIGFDDHDGWDDIPEDQKELIEGKIKEILKEAAEEANNRNWGSVSSEMRQEIMKMLSNEIKWESLLKRFCGFTKRDERRSSIRKLNRKYPGVHSGFKKIYKPMIAVYIDESGSVSNQELSKFYAELDNLSNRTDFYVYKFDHSVDEKSSFLWKKNSRPNMQRTLVGGTCFNAVTKHAIKNKKKFDGYIVLTDGGAPKPDISRGLKRCWILATGCKLMFNADQSDIVINIK
jgi:predicted metal-dependent peptidase